jgi:cellulase/cellobiase CelA1
MPKNSVVTPYDDAGYPALASSTVPLTATGVVKNSAGRLLKIVVTTTLSAAAITIYDNAAAAAGTVLFVIPASAAAGSIYSVDLPAVNGIFASFAGTGSVTFGYA